MEYFHDHNGKDGMPAWHDWCYAPMAAARAITSAKGDSFAAITDMAAISALAPWRLNKQVYRMDPDTERMLMEQTELSIPGEILLHLPFDSFYVELSTDLLGLSDLHGFFVHLEDDANSHEAELRILYLKKDGTVLFGYPVYIGTGTIQESQEKVAEVSGRNMAALHLDAPVTGRDMALLEPCLTKTLQVILYLCSANKDVQMRESTKERPQKSSPARQRDVRDRYQDLQQYDVGIRVGAAIRKSRILYATSPGGSTGSHASPRPHMRRGHWHHFWRGKRSEPEARELVLHWIAPTAINAALAEENAPIRIQDVY